MNQPLDFRGIYFATHFNNSYQTWPVGEVERLIGEYHDLGAGVFMNWLDLNEVRWEELSVEGSAAARYLQRVRRLAAHARGLGMKTACGGIANACSIDQYSEDLAADISGWSGRSAYKHQLCLSKPEAAEICAGNFLRLAALMPGSDFLSVWTYDQGGCDCAACRPFAVTAARFAKQLEARLGAGAPELLLSVWHMSEEEARAMLEEIAVLWPDPRRRPRVFANLDSRPWHHGPSPALLRRFAQDQEFRFIGFSEVTMQIDDSPVGSSAWWRLGANPMPRYYLNRIRQNRLWITGLMTYSEGIFDHLNQFILLRGPDSPGCSAEDLVAEYGRRFFLLENPAPFLRWIERLEANWLHLEPSRYAAETLRSAEDASQAIPEQAKDFRWQSLWLRTRLDLLIANLRETPGNEAVKRELDAELESLRNLYRAPGDLWLPVSAESLDRSPGLWTAEAVRDMLLGK